MLWMSSTAIGSTPANGSSSRMNFGLMATARAISVRRRSPPRKLDAEALADFGQAELLDQVFEPLGLIVFRKVRHLQHGLDVVFDREPPEYRSLLRQIPHAFLGAFVYRFLGDLLILEEDLTLVGLDQADDHVERRRLAGAVGPSSPTISPWLTSIETWSTTVRALYRLTKSFVYNLIRMARRVKFFLQS